MVESSDVFKKHYQEYCAQMAAIDFNSIKEELGIIQSNDRMYIPFFNDKYVVSNSGIVTEAGEKPEYRIAVILAKYILLCPDQFHYAHSDADWVSFKDFKRTSHFTNVNYFSSDTERVIERHFSGKLN